MAQKSRKPRRPAGGRSGARPENRPGQRRAFTPARSPGEIDQGGDPVLATRLVDALRAAREDSDRATSCTHGLHTYPARMHPATAHALLGLVIPGSAPADRPAVVLDPFCGSGTVLVEACRAGARAIGVDANPLAVAIARAKTWLVPCPRRDQLREVAHSIANRALAEGKAARRAGYEPPPLRAPRGVDPEERNRRLTEWFAPHVRRELEGLAAAIDELEARDRELAEILTVVLSSILYKVSRRASDTDATRVERRIGRGQAARLFRDRVDRLVRGLATLARGHHRATASSSAPPPNLSGGLRPEVHIGDARHLDDLGGPAPSGIGTGSIDVIVTSPPYAGTYDYADQHRLRLDFLGIPASDLERSEIGARRHFSGDGEARRRARRRWTRAFSAALGEIERVLAPGGQAVLMIGDSIAGDRVIWADEALATALETRQLRVIAWAWQSRPRLGSREYQLFGERHKRECLFLLRPGGPKPDPESGSKPT